MGLQAAEKAIKKKKLFAAAKPLIFFTIPLDIETKIKLIS